MSRSDALLLAVATALATLVLGRSVTRRVCPEAIGSAGRIFCFVATLRVLGLWRAAA